MDRTKYGWCFSKGEIIPLLPSKEHLGPITAYADEHNIYKEESLKDE